MEQLNHDFDAFYEFCKENHLTDEDVKQLCQPLIKTIRKEKLIKQLQIGVFIMLILLTIYLVCNTEIISWHLSAIGRILLVKILPIYDWTQLQNEYCLIQHSETIAHNNPNCILCESVEEIEQINEYNPDFLYENLIKLHIPFKITKTDLSWKIKTNSVSNLTKILTENTILSTSMPCKLSTNLFKNYNDISFREILNRALNAHRYFIHFQNCEWNAIKQFRSFTPRPSFLHRDIAPIQYSWLLMDNNYKVGKFKRIDLIENIAVVVQIFGRTNFKLLPQKHCEFECFELETVLEEDEVLVVTNLWDLEYKPIGFGENVAVILETH